MGKGIVLLGLGVIAMALLYPDKAVEVDKLTPVEVLVATVERGQVTLSGGGLEGYGATWEEALSDLEQHGQAFFATTGHVVAEESLLEAVMTEPRLRPAAKVYRWVMPLGDSLTAYLQVHPGNVTIADLRRGECDTIPVVLQKKGGFCLG